jgi:hypothetical protein
MPTEEEELKLIVTLVDNATPGLKQINEQIKALGGGIHPVKPCLTARPIFLQAHWWPRSPCCNGNKGREPFC